MLFKIQSEKAKTTKPSPLPEKINFKLSHPNSLALIFGDLEKGYRVNLDHLVQNEPKLHELKKKMNSVKGCEDHFELINEMKIILAKYFNEL